MSRGTYKTPVAFKTAVEQRLKNAAREGGELDRRRQLLVFDRFLARVVRELGDAVVLKGGLVLELRLQLDSCYQHACEFINPVLAKKVNGMWDPESWLWNS